MKRGMENRSERAEGCCPAAHTSNPADRASSRNSDRLRSFPPTNTIISNAGGGLPPSSGDTPFKTTTRPTGRAASAQRLRIAVASVSGQSLSTLFSR